MSDREPGERVSARVKRKATAAAKEARRRDRIAHGRLVEAAECEQRASSLARTIATIDAERVQLLIRAAVLRYGVGDG